MKYSFLALVVAGLFSGNIYADCKQDGPPVVTPGQILDLSTLVVTPNASVTQNLNTKFTGTFNCKFTLLLSNTVSVVSSLSNGGKTVIGFNNGTQFIEMTLGNITQTTFSNLAVGAHNASELNTSYTLNFKLLTTNPGGNSVKIVPAETFQMTPIMLATDSTGLGLLQLLLRIVANLLTLLLTGQWPVNESDIFYEPITVIYQPKVSTCSFDNAGLAVQLPLTTRSALLTTTRPGYTPFTLNMSCKDLLANNTASRAISMFLSSNTLLTNDNSTMTNTLTQGTKGVGVRIVTPAAQTTPVILSPSNTAQGTATNLFSVAKGGTVSPTFQIPLAAYYYAYTPQAITQGQFSSSATLNISYQ